MSPNPSAPSGSSNPRGVKKARIDPEPGRSNANHRAGSGKSKGKSAKAPPTTSHLHAHIPAWEGRDLVVEVDKRDDPLAVSADDLDWPEFREGPHEIEGGEGVSADPLEVSEGDIHWEVDEDTAMRNAARDNRDIRFSAVSEGGLGPAGDNWRDAHFPAMLGGGLGLPRGERAPQVAELRFGEQDGGRSSPPPIGSGPSEGQLPSSCAGPRPLQGLRGVACLRHILEEHRSDLIWVRKRLVNHHRNVIRTRYLAEKMSQGVARALYIQGETIRAENAVEM